MTYKEIEKATKGKTFPLAGKNEDGENIIIQAGRDDDVGGRFFKLTTAQGNGWTRIEHIFEDGTTTEEYEK